MKESNEHKTSYHFFKRLPQKYTVTHFKELVSHHNWLMTFGDFSTYLHDISKIKLTDYAKDIQALFINICWKTK